mgnify:CR=1 FL=1
MKPDSAGPHGPEMRDDMDITKKEFEAYEKARESGLFNMMMQARDAASFAGLQIDRYWKIIKNYDECLEKYATAALICEAVNNHARLKAENEELVEMCKPALDHLNPNPSHSIIEADAHKAIYQALSRSKEEQP